MPQLIETFAILPLLFAILLWRNNHGHTVRKSFFNNSIDVINPIGEKILSRNTVEYGEREIPSNMAKEKYHRIWHKRNAVEYGEREMPSNMAKEKCRRLWRKRNTVDYGTREIPSNMAQQKYRRLGHKLFYNQPRYLL